MEGQKALGLNLKHLKLRSEDEQPWNDMRVVINDIIFIFVCTNPLRH